MKSIKPGRGPSMMGGVMGIVVAVFGVFWTIGALRMGAGGFFALFGVVFVFIAIFNAAYNFKNATSENRYSSYDITDDGEEPDPLNQRFGREASAPSKEKSSSAFCPYCGNAVDGDYTYCNKCGKKLP